MTDINTNVSNYTYEELMAIIDVSNPFNKDDILNNTTQLINKFKHKTPSLSKFFQDIQNVLLNEDDDDEENDDYEDDDEENEGDIQEGFTSKEHLKDKLKDKLTDQVDQKDTIVDEKTTNNTATYNLPIKKDMLNPNLKNTITRYINLDSQFRPYMQGSDNCSTNYTVDLSDTLKDTISLGLYSFQIPFSWYAIDEAYGNTCFWIIDNNTQNAIPITILPGNYTSSTFQTQLNNSFLLAGFTFPSYNVNNTVIPINSPVYYNSINGLITLFLHNGVFNDPVSKLHSFTITTETKIIFYDFTGILQANVSCKSSINHYFNNTLGWIMGYKIPYINVNPNGNTASAILDLNGTKYLILSIDDYNQNHVNDGLVSITQYSKTLKMPSYYSTDIPFVCHKKANNLSQLISTINTNNNQEGLLIASKYENDYTSTQVVLPSNPRTLTQSQLYTINSINNNNNNLTNFLAKAPTSSDIIGILPVKSSTGVPTGSLLVELSGSLQTIKRTYFGPVNIDRMSIKLLNDKGHILNLNGNEWCFTLVCECLYQY